MINAECISCANELPDGARFCTSCGVNQFAEPCSGCSYNPESSHFCAACGSKLLLANAAPMAQEPQITPQIEAERTFSADAFNDNWPAESESKEEDRLQVVTILFADVKGFTALSEKLSPDQVKYIMDHILGSLSERIEEQSGYIDKYMGDAIMAVFGAHSPGADDAYKAAKAALKMQTTLTEMSQVLEKKTGHRIQMRIGINTGRVLVGAVGKGREKDFTVMGDAVNLAQRLESNAPVGSILISASTQRQVKGAFTLKRMPPMMVKGKSEPVQTYEVVDEAPLDLGGATAEFNGLTIPLAARGAELRSIQNAFEGCETFGESNTVLITGEQGIGKSALAFEFIDRLDSRNDPILLFMGKPEPGSPQTADSLLADIIRRRFDVRQAGDKERALRQLCEGLDTLIGFASASGEQSDEVEKQVAWLRPKCEIFFANLLGIGHEDHPTIVQLASIEGARRRMITTLFVDLLNLCAKRAPVVVILENTPQHGDSALAMLSKIQRQLADTSIFFLLIGRRAAAKRVASARESANLTGQMYDLALQPLSENACRELLDDVLEPLDGGRHFPYDKLIQHSQGIPYYVLELLNLLIDQKLLLQQESGYRFEGTRDGEIGLPDTVTALLQARLGNLPKHAHALLQRGAVVGQSFWWSTINEGRAAQATIDDLLAREFIHNNPRSRLPMEREFAFNSPMVWELCRSTVPEHRRKVIHAEIYRWLQNQPIEHSLELNIALGRHQRAAGAIRECFATYLRAADLAFSNDDYQTASELYKEADELSLSGDLYSVFSSNDDPADDGRGFDASQVGNGARDFRLASLDERMAYLERYVHALVMSAGIPDREVVEAAGKYMDVIRIANRRAEDESTEARASRDEYMCILWKMILTYSPGSITLDQHTEIKHLLGDMSEPPYSRGRVLLWFGLMSSLAIGMEMARDFEEEVLRLYNVVDDLIDTDAFADRELLYTVYKGVVHYLWYYKGDSQAALPYTARAASAAIESGVFRDIIDALCGFACCLIGTSHIQLGAQILRYLQNLEKRIGTQHATLVNLSNEAESYMLSGLLATAELRYREAVAELEENGIRATHETDTYSQYAMLRLTHCKDPEVDNLLDSAEHFARMSHLMSGRWLRAKALSQWTNFENLDAADELITEGRQLSSGHPAEALATELVWLQILDTAADQRISTERQRVEKTIGDNPELRRMWSNYLETGTVLPIARPPEEDKPFPELDKDAVEALVSEYCAA